MRKTKPQRKSKTITVSMASDLAQFVDKRVDESPCRTRTEYFSRLVEHDRDHNTLGEIFNFKPVAA